MEPWFPGGRWYDDTRTDWERGTSSIGRLWWDGARREVVVVVAEWLSKGDTDPDRNDSFDNWNSFPPELILAVRLDDWSGFALLMYCFRYRCVSSGATAFFSVPAPSNEGGCWQFGHGVCFSCPNPRWSFDLRISEQKLVQILVSKAEHTEENQDTIGTSRVGQEGKEATEVSRDQGQDREPTAYNRRV